MIPSPYSIILLLISIILSNSFSSIICQCSIYSANAPLQNYVFSFMIFFFCCLIVFSVNIKSKIPFQKSILSSNSLSVYLLHQSKLKILRDSKTSAGNMSTFYLNNSSPNTIFIFETLIVLK